MKELNDVLNKVEDLKRDNESLKSELKEKCIELGNLKKKFCDVTNGSIHVLAKPLYNSFFKKKHQNESAKIGINQIKDTKIKVSTDDRGSEDEKDINDSVKSINKTKPRRSNQNLATLQNKQIELEPKLNHLETRLNNSAEKALSLKNLKSNLKLDEIADCVELMKPLINCLIKNQAILNKEAYLAQQNIKLNVDNGKLDGWYPEANDEYINLPIPNAVFG